jgi:hypothetical protein
MASFRISLNGAGIISAVVFVFFAGYVGIVTQGTADNMEHFSALADKRKRPTNSGNFLVPVLYALWKNSCSDTVRDSIPQRYPGDTKWQIIRRMCSAAGMFCSSMKMYSSHFTFCKMIVSTCTGLHVFFLATMCFCKDHVLLFFFSSFCAVEHLHCMCKFYQYMPDIHA